MLNLLISQRVIVDSHNQRLDALEGNYSRYFGFYGIRLYSISNFIKDPGSYLGQINYDGLVLSGGGDMSPECYELKKIQDPGYSPEREKTEIYLIKKMAEKRLPILGICHGMHQINCFFGGKVTADIHKGKTSSRKPKMVHRIRIDKPVFGLTGGYDVNHYHNDGIKKEYLADTLDIFATDPDFGNVEGFVHKDLPVVGIQWHPERDSPDPEMNRQLIRSLFNIKDYLR